MRSTLTRPGGYMKRVLIGLIVVLAAVALFVLGTGARTSIQDQAVPKEGKDQPKKVTLDQDSLDDKWGAVAFDHETHSVKKYNPDGGAVKARTVFQSPQQTQ